MAFTPKFADLVRNYSTTVGTGDFVLGAAVTGFAGFAATLQPGDSFYYSAIGVDKPSEREVGRGTLQPDGTIGREPIGGTKTNFSSGTKTIALIAAAEWFSQMQSSAPSAPGAPPAAVAATRGALAATPAALGCALLIEPGAEGLFVFEGSNLSAMVAADTAQAVHVAPASDPTGASGAWVRRFAGALNVRWFGAVGDWDGATGDGTGVTDNLPAFNAAITFVRASATNVINAGLWTGGYSLYVPRPEGSGYFLSGRVEVKGVSLLIEGPATQWGLLSPTLRFADDSDGFVFHMNNTIGDTAEAGAGTGAAIASGLRGLNIVGGGTSLTSKGVWRRVKAFLDDVHISGFGVGDYINATGGSGGATEGNANGWSNHRVRVANNRSDGAYRAGADANTGSSVNGQYDSNGGWGLNDESFLGNSYIGEHSATNISGAYRTTNANARHLLLNCYSEGDQPAASFHAQTLVLGGHHDAGVSAGSAWLHANTDPGVGIETAGNFTIGGNATLGGQLIGKSELSAVNGHGFTSYAGYFSGAQITMTNDMGFGFGAGIYSRIAGGAYQPLSLFGTEIRMIPGDGAVHAVLDAAGLSVAGKVSGTNVPDAGVAFPTNPVAGNRFFRTDRGIEYYYNGTRWLSTQLFRLQIATASATVSATASVGTVANPEAGLHDIFAADVIFSTVLTGSGNWTAEVHTQDGASDVVLATGGAFTNTVRDTLTVAVNAVVAMNIDAFYLKLIENSGTAAATGQAALRYRLIG